MLAKSALREPVDVMETIAHITHMGFQPLRARIVCLTADPTDHAFEQSAEPFADGADAACQALEQGGWAAATRAVAVCAAAGGRVTSLLPVLVCTLPPAGSAHPSSDSERGEHARVPLGAFDAGPK